jgi:hypothetical protein
VRSARTVITRYVFQNVIQSVPVIATLNAADAILTLAALGFLGYGIQPTDAAEWGYDSSRAISDAGAGIWESRDLRDLLEARWARAGEDRFEPERAVLGDLELLDEASTHIRVPAARGRSGAEVAEMLGRVRADQPDEPLWKGVRSVEPSASDAAIAFDDPVDPARGDGAVQVACHLYPGR